MTAMSECEICGVVVQARVAANWHPAKVARRVEWALQEHLQTHPAAAVARLEMRKNLDLLPLGALPELVRDIYRRLLGTEYRGHFVLGVDDRVSSYSIDEALGSASAYRLWRAANQCALPGCACQH